MRSVPEPGDLADEFYPAFKREVRLALLQLLQNIKEEGIFPNPLYDLIIKVRQRHYKKKILQANILEEHAKVSEHKYKNTQKYKKD